MFCVIPYFIFIFILNLKLYIDIDIIFLWSYFNLLLIYSLHRDRGENKLAYRISSNKRRPLISVAPLGIHIEISASHL